MNFKDLIVGTAIAGSTFFGGGGAQAQESAPATEQKAQTAQDKVMLGDFDITEYADFMKKRGFEVQLDKSGVGVYAGTEVAMLEVVSTRKVDGYEITVSDYLLHRAGRDFTKESDGQKYDAGDLESRELTVKGTNQQSFEYRLNMDYNEREKHYSAVSNVIGTGTRTLPHVSESDGALLLSRIAGNPGAFIQAERTDIQISRRDADGGGRNAPQP